MFEEKIDIPNKQNFDWMKEKSYFLVFLSLVFLSFLILLLSFPPFSIISLSFFLWLIVQSQSRFVLSLLLLLLNHLSLSLFITFFLFVILFFFLYLFVLSYSILSVICLCTLFSLSFICIGVRGGGGGGLQPPGIFQIAIFGQKINSGKTTWFSGKQWRKYSGNWPQLP